MGEGKGLSKQKKGKYQRYWSQENPSEFQCLSNLHSYLEKCQKSGNITSGCMLLSWPIKHAE